MLKVVWWLLLGILISGVGIMMGTDMGVGTILRWVARSDTERRVALNVIGPHWDGNQVWFVLSGGAVFAAWPLLYATAFSGLYVVMMALLWSMMIRPLGFEYRSKLHSQTWRNAWDWGLFISGIVPMFILGVVISSLFLGLPFRFDWNLRSHFDVGAMPIFAPLSLLGGAIAVALATYMGCVRLMLGSDGEIYARSRLLGWWAGMLAVGLFLVAGLVMAKIPGFHLLDTAAAELQQTPMHLSVSRVPHGWLTNFMRHPMAWLLPVTAVVAMFTGSQLVWVGRAAAAWWLGALGWLGVIWSAGYALFPFLLPSSEAPSQSLTVWNAGASEHSMWWLLAITVTLLPLIVWYTGWAFYVMRGKVDAERIDADEHAY